MRVDHGAPGRVMPAVDQELRQEPEPVITLVPVCVKMSEKQAPAQEPTAVSIHIIYCMKHLHITWSLIGIFLFFLYNMTVNCFMCKILLRDATGLCLLTEAKCAV